LTSMLAIMTGKVILDLNGIKPSIPILDNITGFTYLWFSVAPCFIAGILAYLYRDKLPRSRVLAAILVLLFIGSAHTSTLLCDVLFPFVAAYLTFFIAFSHRRVPDAAKFGDFSYGIYLYGFPIEQMLATTTLSFALYVPAA